MAEWKRICCAVDFSKPCAVAMRTAAELAGRLGAELTLLHVLEPQPPVAVDLLAAHPEALEAAAGEMQRRVHAWAAEAQKLSGAPVRATLLDGADVAGEIVRWVRERGADAIVIATHGRTGLAHVMMGSVAERIMQRAEVPVLVVRRQT